MNFSCDAGGSGDPLAEKTLTAPVGNAVMMDDVKVCRAKPAAKIIKGTFIELINLGTMMKHDGKK